MNLNFKVYFKERDTNNVLCATCAIEKVINENKIVDITIDEHDAEYSTKDYSCQVCDRYIKTQSL